MVAPRGVAPRRILIFVDGFSIGGAERQVFLLAKHLRQAGHRVEVWGFESGQGEGSLQIDLARIDVVTRTIQRSLCWSWVKMGRRHGYIYNLLALRELVREWRRQLKDVPTARFDWAIPFTPDPGLYLLLYRGRIQTKVLVWNHRGGADPGGFPYNRALALIGQWRLDGWVANSRVGVSYLAGLFGVSGDYARFMPNIYEVGDSSARSDQRRRSTGAIIVQVANIYPEKDPETLIRAFSLIRDHSRQPTLVLVGRWTSGEQFENARRLVKALGISDQVTFAGELNSGQVNDMLGRAAIGVLSSRSEGCPNSVLEYMGHALPIVATRISGIEQMLPADSKACLFDVGDHVECAERLKALLDDPERSDALGLANRRMVESAYSGPTVVEQWSEYLESLASRSFLTRILARTALLRSFGRSDVRR